MDLLNQKVPQTMLQPNYKHPWPQVDKLAFSTSAFGEDFTFEPSDSAYCRVTTVLNHHAFVALSLYIGLISKKLVENIRLVYYIYC